MVRNTIMEKNQQNQRSLRSPVMISSPGYPTAIIAADATPSCLQYELLSAGLSFMVKMISMSSRGTVRSQSMYRYASLNGTPVRVGSGYAPLAPTVWAPPAAGYSYASTQLLKIRM